MIKKTTLIILAAAALFAGCNKNASTAVNTDENGMPKLANMADTLSWITGMNIAQTLPTETFFKMNPDLVVEAMRYTLKGMEQPIDDTTFNGGMQYIMIQDYAFQKKHAADMRRAADSTQKAYFKQLVAKNKKVKSHPSGLYYEVLREGKGPKAGYAKRIRFDYRSYTLDGEVYDQTYGNRGSIIHVVGTPMFQGLIEGFQLMNAGSLYRFYFPYQLLGNEEGSGSVKAYTPMIYDIELHEIYND